MRKSNSMKRFVAFSVFGSVAYISGSLGLNVAWAESGYKERVEVHSYDQELPYYRENVGVRIQNEPTTTIQASPLHESPTDRLKNQRRQMENETEQILVQEIESARVAEERKRREKIQGSLKKSLSGLGSESSRGSYPHQNPYPQNSTPPNSGPYGFQQGSHLPVPQRPPVVQVGVVQMGGETPQDEVSGESQTSLKNSKIQDSQGRYYFGFAGGLTGVKAKNVKGRGAVGFSLGYKGPVQIDTPGAFGLDGDFIYSRMDQKNDTYYNGTVNKNINQYQFSGALRYYLGRNRLMPSVGLVGAFTRRSFVLYGKRSSFSNSFDTGLSAGVDMKLGHGLEVGFEYRYMMNVDFDKEGGAENSDFRPFSLDSIHRESRQQSLESIDYHMFLIRTKFRL